jgi:four helix bundle protein
MQRFSDLRVWQRANALAVRIFRVTQSFPRDDRLDLKGQMRRSSTSAPFNIAEGAKRVHASEYAKFLNIAEASLAECEAQVRFARDIEYLDAATADALADEASQICRMLYALRRQVTAKKRA